MSYVKRTLGTKETELYSTGYHWLYWSGVTLLIIPFLLTALGSADHLERERAISALVKKGNAVVKKAAEYEVVTLSSHEPDLEDLFLTYYGIGENDAA